MIEWLAQTLGVPGFVGATLVIGIGAALQGTVGYGMALVASPLLIMIEPRFIPGPFILASQLLSLLVVWREWRAIDFSGIKWAVVGRVPGTIAAGLLLAVISQRAMVLTFGVLVLAAVAMSLAGLRFSPRRAILATAGALSGLMGTIATIGGPPMAFVYQDEPGEKLRPTLAGYFLIASALALVTLYFVGRFGLVEVVLAMALMPGICVGYLTSSKILPLLQGRNTKAAILAVATISAIVVLLRELL